MKRKERRFTYVFLLVDNVDAEYREIKSKGVKFESEPGDTSWGGRVASLRDPDGNMVLPFTMEGEIRNFNAVSSNSV
jgi:uncharacterized glyoxalase superfamily protein PhnB